MRARYEDNCLMHIKMKRQTYFILEGRHVTIKYRFCNKQKFESGCQGKRWAARRISLSEVFQRGMARAYQMRLSPLPMLRVMVRREKKPGAPIRFRL